MRYEQRQKMLVSVLEQLQQSRNPLFEYPAAVIKGYYDHFLVELIPRPLKVRFRKKAQDPRQRVAIRLCQAKEFIVYRPYWLMPLEEELAAIASPLGDLPGIATNFVDAWRGWNDEVIHGHLVAEVQTELAEARQDYWTRKVAEIEEARKAQLTSSTN